MRGGGRGGRQALAAALALSAAALAACNDSGRTTNVFNNGVDCGLVRDDLVGSWSVTVVAGTRSFTNCTGTGSSGSVTTSGSPITYSNVTVTANTSAAFPEGGVGYTVIGAGVNRSDELIANLEADSCLAQFQVWFNADKAYVQCLGTFDRSTLSIAANCDSAESDSDGNGTVDTFCSLSSALSATAHVL